MRGVVGPGQYFSRVTRLCIFSLVTVIVGNAVLLVVPQAREAIAAFDEDTHDVTQSVFFILAFAYWTLASWYCCRLLLGRRFKYDVLGVCSCGPFALCLIRWFPRILGLAAIIPITVGFLLDRPKLYTGLWMSVVGVALSIFVVKRQRWFGGLRQSGRPDGEWYRKWHEQFARFDEMNLWARCSMTVMMAIPLAVIGAVTIFGTVPSRDLGSPTLVLTFLGGFVTYGSMILIYLPLTFGLPRLIIPVCCAIALFSGCNENHLVGQRDLKETAEAQQGLQAAYRAWDDCRPNKGGPIAIVATAGGASRAALWTGLVLSSFESGGAKGAQASVASGPCPRMANVNGPKNLSDDVFAISSVSGGSVGATAYVAALAARADPECQIDDNPALWKMMNQYLGRDWLSPIIGPMLFEDSLQNFIPRGIPYLDRSRTLEKAWEDDWAEVLETNYPGKPKCPNPFAHPMSVMYQGGKHLPFLLLNTSAVESGRRVMQSTVTFPYPETVDLFQKANQVDLDVEHLTLSGAVHNTARFPYVSPAGLVFNKGADRDREKPWDYLVDGGYFENSGTATATAMIRALRNIEGGPSRIFVIVIDNDLVTKPTDSYCDKARAPANTTDPTPTDHATLWHELGWKWVAQLTGPPFGLYETRSSRGEMAIRELLDLVGGCDGKNFAEIHLPRDGARQIAMSWFLDRDSRDQMQCDLKDPEMPNGHKSGAPITSALPTPSESLDSATDMRINLQANLQKVRDTFHLAPSDSLKCTPKAGGGYQIEERKTETNGGKNVS